MKINCLLFFFLVSSCFSFSQKLTATQKLPNEIQPSSFFIAEILINKGNLSGFIKFVQVLPAGFSAEEIDSKNGNFAFGPDGIRIVWSIPPDDTSFILSYKVHTPAEITGATITGKVSYIDGNERKMFDLPPHNFKISETSLPSTNQIVLKKEENMVGKETIKKEAVDASQPINTTKIKEEKVGKELAKTEMLKEKKEKKEEEPDAKKQIKESTKVVQELSIVENPPQIITAKLSSVDEKNYKVQIGAFKAKPKIEGISEISILILDNGLTKYFTGNFLNYEDAVKRKELAIKKGFSGAFIVSFKDGKIVK